HTLLHTHNTHIHTNKSILSSVHFSISTYYTKFSFSCFPGDVMDHTGQTLEITAVRLMGCVAFMHIYSLTDDTCFSCNTYRAELWLCPRIWTRWTPRLTHWLTQSSSSMTTAWWRRGSGRTLRSTRSYACSLS